MDDGDLPPAQQDPDQVHDDGKAARFAGLVHQLVSERAQRIAAQLEQLNAERNADDGDAHQKPHDEIDDSHEDTPEYEPQKIAEKVHFRSRVSICEKSSMMISAPAAARSSRDALP